MPAARPATAGRCLGANLRSITIALDEAYRAAGQPDVARGLRAHPERDCGGSAGRSVARAFTGAACNLMDMGAASSTGCATGSGITVQRIQLVGCGTSRGLYQM